MDIARRVHVVIFADSCTNTNQLSLIEAFAGSEHGEAPNFSSLQVFAGTFLHQTPLLK